MPITPSLPTMAVPADSPLAIMQSRETIPSVMKYAYLCLSPGP